MFLPAGLEALSAIIEYGTFELAAEKLRVSQSAISQRIKQLEDQLGAPVVVREKPARATEVGMKVLKFSRQVLSLEQDLHAELSDGPPEWEVVRIALNSDSLDTWLLDALATTLRKEKILLQLMTTDEGRTQDCLQDGRAAAAITIHKEPITGCDSLKIGDIRYHAVCTKRFRRQFFPKGVNPNSLTTAPYLNFDDFDNLHEQWLWKHFKLSSQGIPQSQIPSPQSFVDFTRRGLAYSLCPWMKIESLVQKGKLIDLSPAHTITRSLYWHSWRYQSRGLSEVTKAIRAFSRVWR